jgi:hypothetical protein
LFHSAGASTRKRAIQRIRQLRGEGLSLRAISAGISAEGVKLSHEGVKNVLESDGPKVA